MQPPATAPTTKRIAQLDALRGIAVMGIALMNVYAFALPSQAYYNLSVWGFESATDRVVWIVSFVFFEDKFRTLFAMLFGAGCLILLERNSQQEGGRPWRAHYARMAVLFVLGLLHAVLLASNDVLRAYALAGLALPFLSGLSAPALYAVAIGLVVAHVGAGMVVFGSGVIDFYAGRLGSDAVLFAERNFGSQPGALEYALDLGRESFAERVARRSSGIGSQLTNLGASLPLNLAAMALGMALWRDRMLAREWRTFRMQRLAAICAIVAIPALLVIAWWVGDAGFPGALVGPAALVVSAPFDTLMGLSYALLVMALLSTSGGATKALCAVGRLSLTNYIATSLIFSVMFSAWGLGLFAEITRSQALALSVLPIAAMLVWSPVWIAVLGQGPFERLWRRAATLLS